MTSRRSTIRRLLQEGTAHLFPGYIALVMAAGARSIAGHRLAGLAAACDGRDHLCLPVAADVDLASRDQGNYPAASSRAALITSCAVPDLRLDLLAELTFGLEQVIPSPTLRQRYPIPIT